MKQKTTYLRLKVEGIRFKVEGRRLKVEGSRFSLILALNLFFICCLNAQDIDYALNGDSVTKKRTSYNDSQAKVNELQKLRVNDVQTLIARSVKGLFHVDSFNAISNIITTDSSLKQNPLYNKKRVKLVVAANIIGYGAASYGLYNAWYKDYPQSSFHFFNDNKEWLQVDKVGHMYSAYIESKGSMEVWRWAGVSRKQRIWYGGLSGAVYQTIIETLDGFSRDWGWSWGDFAANMMGSGLLIGQELLWDEQRIDFKFSFHKKNYNEPTLHARADSLYGSSILSRMLKDYNGQTYWLSANLKSFFPKSKLPAWLNVAVGYGAEGMYGADDNIWKDRTGTTINRTDITRYRQWYIAPDINLMKIKTKSKILKVALFFFNSFKFPLPSIGFSKKGVEWNWIHF